MYFERAPSGYLCHDYPIVVSYLRFIVWLEEKGNAVALASQLVNDAVHRRPQLVVGPVLTREGQDKKQDALT